MVKSMWQKLLKSALETHENEINCEECYELLDQYVDLLAEGADPSQIMPTVKQHLDQCTCCTGAFEALMTIIHNAENELPSVI